MKKIYQKFISPHILDLRLERKPEQAIKGKSVVVQQINSSFYWSENSLPRPHCRPPKTKQVVV